jgi:hypothetical protein
VPGIFLASAEVDRALEAVGGRFRDLDNSHPFIVDKRVRTSSEGLTDTTLAEASPSPSATASPSESGSQVLPGDTDAANGDQDVVKKTKKSVDDTVGQITDGLSGVVSTILPDPLDPGQLGQ